MTEPAPASVPPPQPTLLGAWRGIWLFTWRPQLAWRRLPLLLLGLVALPALVFLTTPSPSSWTQRPAALGNPFMRFRVMANRLAQADARLRPEQQEPMRRIFSEEFDRVRILGRDAIRRGPRRAAAAGNQGLL